VAAEEAMSYAADPEPLNDDDVIPNVEAQPAVTGDMGSVIPGGGGGGGATDGVVEVPSP